MSLSHAEVQRFPSLIESRDKRTPLRDPGHPQVDPGHPGTEIVEQFPVPGDRSVIVRDKAVARRAGKRQDAVALLTVVACRATERVEELGAVLLCLRVVPPELDALVHITDGAGIPSLTRRTKADLPAMH